MDLSCILSPSNEANTAQQVPAPAKPPPTVSSQRSLPAIVSPSSMSSSASSSSSSLNAQTASTTATSQSQRDVTVTGRSSFPSAFPSTLPENPAPRSSLPQVSVRNSRSHPGWLPSLAHTAYRPAPSQAWQSRDSDISYSTFADIISGDIPPEHLDHALNHLNPDDLSLLESIHERALLETTLGSERNTTSLEGYEDHEELDLEDFEDLSEESSEYEYEYGHDDEEEGEGDEEEEEEDEDEDEAEEGENNSDIAESGIRTTETGGMPGLFHSSNHPRNGNSNSASSSRRPSTIDLTDMSPPLGLSSDRNVAGRPNFSTKRPAPQGPQTDNDLGRNLNKSHKRRRLSNGTATPGASSSQQTRPKIEEIDLLDDSDEAESFQKTLQKQRVDQIASQNKEVDNANAAESSKEGTEGGGKGTRLTRTTCSICMEDMHEMTATICGHLFCRSCLHSWTSRPRSGFARPKPPTCPSCRTSIAHTAKIHRSVVLNFMTKDGTEKKSGKHPA